MQLFLLSFDYEPISDVVITYDESYSAKTELFYNKENINYIDSVQYQAINETTGEISSLLSPSYSCDGLLYVCTFNIDNSSSFFQTNNTYNFIYNITFTDINNITNNYTFNFFEITNNYVSISFNETTNNYEIFNDNTVISNIEFNLAPLWALVGIIAAWGILWFIRKYLVK